MEAISLSRDNDFSWRYIYRQVIGQNTFLYFFNRSESDCVIIHQAGPNTSKRKFLKSTWSVYKLVSPFAIHSHSHVYGKATT